MSGCDNCQSLFFKTLESRFIPGEACLLFKRRCKRCKFKSLVRKDGLSGHITRITLEQWRVACKIPAGPRGQIFTSEYTRRISQCAEETAAYLGRIRRAEGGA